MTLTLPLGPFFKPCYGVLKRNLCATVLVPMGKRGKKRRKKNRNVNIHIVFRDASCLESKMTL